MKTSEIIAELLDLGFEGASTRGNVEMPWNYRFIIATNSPFGLIVLINDTKGIIWTEANKLFGKKRIPKKGKEYDDFQKMLDDIHNHKERHPTVFTNTYDENRREVEMQVERLEYYLANSKHYGNGSDIKTLTKELKASKKQLAKYINNPKVK